MSAWWIVMRKELLDAFRDRRMVMVAFIVMPLAVPLLLAGLSSIGTKRQVEKLEKTLELPVIGAEQAPNLVAWLGTNDVRVIAPPAGTIGYTFSVESMRKSMKTNSFLRSNASRMASSTSDGFSTVIPT